MRLSKYLPALLLAILLTACLVANYLTRVSTSSGRPENESEKGEQSLVDTSLLQTAMKLSFMAATADEQRQAREAWRLADHELDLTFAAALRDAEGQAQLPPTGPLRQLSDRIDTLKKKIDADKKRVDQ